MCRRDPPGTASHSASVEHVPRVEIGSTGKVYAADCTSAILAARRFGALQAGALMI
jgi:hypothetical protein